METHDRRAYARVGYRLFAKFSKAGLYTPVEGVTENISQGGAFVKTDKWEAFHPRERVIVTFFLTPDLTGQDKTIGLQGEGIIARVDREGTGVGVQFAAGFDQFAEIELLDIKHKTRHKRLSHYLIEAASLPLTEFAKQYPNGFFVEQSRHLFDKKIIVKFDTDVIDDRNALPALERGIGRKETLDLRVIEISAKSSLSYHTTKKYQADRLASAKHVSAPLKRPSDGSERIHGGAQFQHHASSIFETQIGAWPSHAQTFRFQKAVSVLRTGLARPFL